ncbi:hypothetical protein JOF37_000302 [Microbacterium imperiale]|uniref:Uncharacterized protein n=1 Tax=Microbacterium imperiale TaxID=33884 RepID=A0A9W6M2V0_9MICO|nr:hypothetical protein [Microbacterium imperiale]BFE39811.1 hypothetical protein GCM10017544_07670 [Microbacterium imperiale]GLJ79214.1 hypothetical protein GCM10017586_08960 [Microbacterium imperiale]
MTGTWSEGRMGSVRVLDRSGHLDESEVMLVCDVAARLVFTRESEDDGIVLGCN